MSNCRPLVAKRMRTSDCHQDGVSPRHLRKTRQVLKSRACIRDFLLSLSAALAADEGVGMEDGRGELCASAKKHDERWWVLVYGEDS